MTNNFLILERKETKCIFCNTDKIEDVVISTDKTDCKGICKKCFENIVLKEQTFDTLAEDNLRVKKLLLKSQQEVKEIKHDRDFYKKAAEEWQKITEELQKDALYEVSPIEYNEYIKNLKQEVEELKAEKAKGIEDFKDVGGCWGCGLQLSLNQLLKDNNSLQQSLKVARGKLIYLKRYIEETFRQYRYYVGEIQPAINIIDQALIEIALSEQTANANKKRVLNCSEIPNSSKR